ncbi:hypothetical protein ALP22_03389 [Pseudomonas coronafaciens pv. porri]|nr:Unknown protein sequence [Pseudomonas coronafaciens pv. porri]RMU87248.1 hypothetical protein ALP22_03389 [Pseudomonas coronafaciens pv. porri]RMW01358.1 hypothetical protein ALP00_03136 [Pseudomonas coronafaciens pv. porri]RMW12040.1 hypothetical protein ALO99_00745 [Pseudomonas coronafaciens pv. porri]
MLKQHANLISEENRLLHGEVDRYVVNEHSERFRSLFS